MIDIILESEEDIYLKKGQSFYKEICILTSTPDQLIEVICGSDGAGGLVLMGNNLCYQVGDKVLVEFPDHLKDCNNIGGCYTISSIVTQCEYPKRTTLFVEEEINPLCCDEGGISFVQPTPTFISPCNVPSKCCPEDREPVIDTPVVLKVCPSELSMKICNRECENVSYEVTLEAVIGCTGFNLCPSGVVKCYDRIDVPTLGIVQGKIVNVIHHHHYDTIYIENVVPLQTSNCLRGVVTGGCVTEVQIIPNDNCCSILYIGTETRQLDVGTPLEPQIITYLGVNDMCDNCLLEYDEDYTFHHSTGTKSNYGYKSLHSLSTSKTSRHQGKFMGYYKLILHYIDEMGLEIKKILLNGKVYVV